MLILTGYGNDAKLFPALEAGALGFLLKDAPTDQLVRAICRAAEGESSLSPRIAKRLVREFAEKPDELLAETLTAREIEVLRQIAGAWSNEEIGGRLSISPACERT